MKKKSTSQSAFFSLRLLIGLFMVLVSVFLALLGFGAFSAQAQQNYTVTSPRGANASSTTAVQPDTPMPDVVQLIGPVILNQDLRDLPYIAPSHEFEEKRLTRYPHPQIPTA